VWNATDWVKALIKTCQGGLKEENDGLMRGKRQKGIAHQGEGGGTGTPQAKKKS